MKILVIGSGGREHALCHTFKRQGHRVFCIPGNAGTEQICESIDEKYQQLDPLDLLELAQFAKTMHIELTVVGPEAPLAQGIAGVFKAEGLALFGPSMLATTLESSKTWSKLFMQKHGIPTAEFQVHKSSETAFKALPESFENWKRVVVKPSGLTAGKGVKCTISLDEARETIQEIMNKERYGKAGKEVVIEEYLEGTECSILAFCDGKRMIPMIPSQDHKRLLDDGKGPNTGGMGAYAPLPFMDRALMHRIDTEVIQPTLNGLNEEGITYKGVLYFGLMLTHAGPKLLEYNCRYGDPEAQAVLPLIESDLANIMQACCHGILQENLIHWKDEAACCVVIASDGYPHSYEKGFPIEGINEEENILIFHAGTKRDESGQIVTNGGRVLGVTGLGDSLEVATENAYRGVDKIHFKGIYFRKDIAGHSCVS